MNLTHLIFFYVITLGLIRLTPFIPFSEHIINPVMVTHIIFSLVFAIGYCVVAEVFPKVKLWQGYGRVLLLLSPFTGSLSLY
jgi:uncharacterized membrane protein YagU involved in acid resistance